MGDGEDRSVGQKTLALISKAESERARAEAAEAQADAAAARETRNAESEGRDKDRLAGIMDKQLDDAKDQRKSAEKNATLWFRLAMAELGVIVAIGLGLAVLFLGGSVSLDATTGKVNVIGDGPVPVAAPVSPAPMESDPMTPDMEPR